MKKKTHLLECGTCTYRWFVDNNIWGVSSLLDDLLTMFWVVDQWISLVKHQSHSKPTSNHFLFHILAINNQINQMIELSTSIIREISRKRKRLESSKGHLNRVSLCWVVCRVLFMVRLIRCLIWYKSSIWFDLSCIIFGPINFRQNQVEFVCAWVRPNLTQSLIFYIN